MAISKRNLKILAENIEFNNNYIDILYEYQYYSGSYQNYTIYFYFRNPITDSISAELVFKNSKSQTTSKAITINAIESSTGVVRSPSLSYDTTCGLQIKLTQNGTELYLNDYSLAIENSNYTNDQSGASDLKISDLYPILENDIIEDDLSFPKDSSTKSIRILTTGRRNYISGIIKQNQNYLSFGLSSDTTLGANLIDWNNNSDVVVITKDIIKEIWRMNPSKTEGYLYFGVKATEQNTRGDFKYTYAWKKITVKFGEKKPVLSKNFSITSKIDNSLLKAEYRNKIYTNNFSATFSYLFNAEKEGTISKVRVYQRQSEAEEWEDITGNNKNIDSYSLRANAQGKYNMRFDAYDSRGWYQSVESPNQYEFISDYFIPAIFWNKIPAISLDAGIEDKILISGQIGVNKPNSYNGQDTGFSLICRVYGTKDGTEKPEPIYEEIITNKVLSLTPLNIKLDVKDYSDYRIVIIANDNIIANPIVIEYKTSLLPVFDFGQNDFNFNVPVNCKNDILIKGQTLKELILETIYPIGSVYMTFRNGEEDNPNNKIGGTWVKIEGKFLLASGQVKVKDQNLTLIAGDTGGSPTQALTVEQMPSHYHTGTTSENGSHSHKYEDYTRNTDYTTFGSGSMGVETAIKTTSEAGDHTHTFTTSSAGNGEEFDIMPPYIAVNIWRRTA